MLNYSVSNFFANGWLNIEDDDYLLYWVKVKSSLSAHVFNNKVQNQLVLYLEGQKLNSSNRIFKLKDLWTALNFKMIQSIFDPNQLHSHCCFPRWVTELFSKRLNNVKDKYKNYGEYEFFANNYEPGQVDLGCIKEYIQSMKSRTVSAEVLIKWNKWFSACNQYVNDFHVKWMKKFGHHVDEEEDESSADEYEEEDSEQEE